MEEKGDEEPEDWTDKDCIGNDLISYFCWKNLSSDNPYETGQANVEENEVKHQNKKGEPPDVIRHVPVTQHEVNGQHEQAKTDPKLTHKHQFSSWCISS